VLGSITSGLVGISSPNFLVDVPRGRGDNVRTIFGSPANPKKMEGQKIVQNSVRFLTTFDFDREYLRDASISKMGKVDYQLQPLVRWVKNVGVLWSINEKVIEPDVYRP